MALDLLHKMLFVSGALRPVMDRAAANGAVQAGMLTAINLQDAVAVLAGKRVVFDDLAVLALNRRKRLRMVYDDVTDLTICRSPR